MAYPTIAAALCAALLIAAALTDALFRRIPNALTLTLLASGLLAQGAVHGVRAAGAGFLAAALVAGLFATPWWFHAVGGGDLKLAAGAAAWIGPQGLVTFLLATALTGGIVSAAVVLTERRRVIPAAPASELTAALAERSSAARRGITVPYGVAIAAGAAYALLCEVRS